MPLSSSESQKEIITFAVGVCHASVCAERAVWPEDVERYMNLQHPTGITSQWKITESHFATGEPNPCECSDDPGRLHYLLTC